MAVAYQSNVQKILTYLKSKGADVAYIQETHFREQVEALKTKRDWVAHVFHNSVSSKSCGVVILINKKLNFVVLNQFKDSHGRILVVEALINGVKVVLCNLYAPNRERTSFFHDVNKTLGNVDGQIILGGDFNQTLDDHLDRSKIRTDTHPRDGTVLNTSQEELGLIDIWRLINPK